MIFLKKTAPERIFKRLANLQFAITLLLIISIVISLGTVIEQDQPLSFYKENYPDTNPIFGFITGNFIIQLGLNTVYTNTWFLILLFIFVSSLLACTFTTQLPTFKKLRLWKFLTSSRQLRNFNLTRKIDKKLANSLIYKIHTNNYHVFRQGKKTYAYQGLLGRLAPIVVHFSIFLLLAGSSFGSLRGYVIQEMIPRGEIFHLQNIVKPGRLSYIKQNATWRINDFWIKYTNNAKVEQFYSDLSILDQKGIELKRKVIFVNEPFFYNGTTIYQTDWNIVGIKIKVGNNFIKQIPLKKIVKNGQNFWLGSIPIYNNSTLNPTILLNNLKGDLFFYDKQGTLLGESQVGESFTFGPTVLTVQDTIATTGLQIKEDPGINFVFFAFFFIMISTYASFLSYSQVWGFEIKNDFFMAGKTNRAVLDFQEKFKKLI